MSNHPEDDATLVSALAEQLLASLDDLKEDEVETLWADEAQRRLEGFRAGKVKAVPATEVHAKAEKLLSDLDPLP